VTRQEHVEINRKADGWRKDERGLQGLSAIEAEGGPRIAAAVSKEKAAGKEGSRRMAGRESLHGPGTLGGRARLEEGISRAPGTRAAARYFNGRTSGGLTRAQHGARGEEGAEGFAANPRKEEEAGGRDS